VIFWPSAGTLICWYIVLSQCGRWQAAVAASGTACKMN